MSAVHHDDKIWWDRLVLLLISQPQEGWEAIYEEVTRREIERFLEWVCGE